MRNEKRTTYNLRFLDNKDWYRGYRSVKRANAEAMARHVADTTGRSVEVYGGEGPYRVAVSVASTETFWRLD